MFGVAINHFQRPEHPLSVRQSTRLAIALLKNCVEITSIVVVDSSAEYDADLHKFCSDIDVTYKHYGRLLSFSEAYNNGVACLAEDWVVTMASDIYVCPDTFTLFKRFIENNPDLPIGCLIPYLSSCDYIAQEASCNAVRHNCYPGMMTYNLNVFPRTVFEKIGGLSSKYSGCFNDIESSLNLKNFGLEVILVDSFAHHYGRLTLQYGTDVNFGTDWDRFYKDHPELLDPKESYQVRLDQLYSHPLLRVAYKLSANIRPRRFRRHIERWVFHNLPVFQRVKG